MNEFEKTIDDILLGALDLIKTPDLEHAERQVGIALVEACMHYFKRKLSEK